MAWINHLWKHLTVFWQNPPVVARAGLNQHKPQKCRASTLTTAPQCVKSTDYLILNKSLYFENWIEYSERHESQQIPVNKNYYHISWHFNAPKTFHFVEEFFALDGLNSRMLFCGIARYFVQQNPWQNLKNLYKRGLLRGAFAPGAATSNCNKMLQETHNCLVWK